MILDAIKNLGPTTLWSGNEASGSLVDSSGNGRTGTVTGTPTYRYQKTTLDSTIKGVRINSAANYVETTASDNIGPGTAYSLILWAVFGSQPAGGAGAYQCAGRVVTAPGSATGTVYLDSTGINYYVHNASPNTETYLVAGDGGAMGAIALNVPYMLAYTFDTSNVAKVYYNGQQTTFRLYQGTAGAPTDGGYVSSATVTTRHNSSASFRIGGQSGLSGSGFGATPDVTVGPIATFTSTLSADNVKALYQASLRGGVVLG